MTFLAIIGLFFILWFLGKGLTRLSNFFNRIGDEMIGASIAIKRAQAHAEPRNEVKPEQEKIDVLKGKEPDSIFKENVRKEIEELTSQESEE
jgi:hypothetical protein